MCIRDRMRHAAVYETKSEAEIYVSAIQKILGQFENLFKNYGDVKAVHDFNLKIDEGEFIVLVGPSGCGKSTLLRMIAGLEKIDEGEIFINDQKINELHPSKRQTAMVFQSYALYPHMNVYENMSFGLKIEKRPKEEINTKVMQAAKILKIEELLERKPKQLSGGQRQRVAIGRAITRLSLIHI